MKTQEKDKCLYMHTRKSDGRIFYIGIGSHDRAYDFINRGEWWKGVYKKNGVLVKILKDNLSLEEACDLEIKMIAFYGRIKPHPNNPNYGCLINLTDGGEGGNGREWTEEQKEYLSSLWTEEKRQAKREANLGENNPMYKKGIYDAWYEKYDEDKVKELIENDKERRRLYMLENNPHKDPEVKNKISKSLTGREFSETHRKNISISATGRKISDEQKQKHSVLMTGSGNANSKLTEDDVRWIRQNYKRYDKVYGMTPLSKRFGVSLATIDLLIARKTWTHVL
jgi:hypothetical protein